MTVTLRAREPQDDAEWLRMRLALWPEGSAAEHRRGMEEWLARPDTITLVAEREDGARLAGFAEVGTRPYADGCESSPVAFLEGWFVDEDVRRQGVGMSLVREAEAWALARGLSEFASDALLENDVSHRAHLALGFEEVERAVRYRKALATTGATARASVHAMKTQYYTATSLDGFLATPDHSLDWLLQFAAEPVGDYAGFLAQVGAIAMGAHTYEWLLRHQVFPDAGEPQPWPYKQPTWVFTTRSLREIPGADVRFVRGDVRPVHERMRAAAAGANIWAMGGGELVGQFHDHGLLDEIIATVAPVTLGAGTPLLPRRIAHPPLQLVEVKQHGPFAELRYRVPRGGIVVVS